MTLGKRCARLDLRQASDRSRFERLIAETDVFVHGYRPEALDGLGFGEDMRRAFNPGLVDVRLDAYGWSGPWRNRRGFDSLVQMSTGIAAAGLKWRSADKPVPLPVQALDHATGYLMAAAAVRGLTLRLTEEETLTARLSLARTAELLVAARGATSETNASSSAGYRRFARHRGDRLGTRATPPAARLYLRRDDGLGPASLPPGLRSCGLGIVNEGRLRLDAPGRVTLPGMSPQGRMGAFQVLGSTARDISGSNPSRSPWSSPSKPRAERGAAADGSPLHDDKASAL